MTEYIERESFIEQKRKQYCSDCNRRKGMKNGKYKTLYDIGAAPCRACGIDDMLNDVEDFPAADVRPVKRGKWNNIIQGIIPSGQCSNCKAWDKVTRFCPNCGADMRQCPEDEAAEEMASVRWWPRREEN